MNKINFFGLFASKYLKQYENLYSKKEKKTGKTEITESFVGFSLVLFLLCFPLKTISHTTMAPVKNGSLAVKRKNRLGFKLPKTLHFQRTDTSWELPAKVPVREFLFFLNWCRACSVRNALFESIFQKTKQTNKSSNKLTFHCLMQCH